MAYAKKEKNGKWSIQFSYEDYAGNKKRKHKLGFKTKKEAEVWMEEFKRKQKADLDMKFESFVEEYLKLLRVDIRESTLRTKEHIIELHILPYFKGRSVADIDALDIKQWQSQIKKKGFADSYLRTINCQMNAIFNHACKFYHLSFNPCHAAGTMGKYKPGNKDIWEQEEMEMFLDAVSDKPVVRYAFFLMYWTGVRVGELLALNIADLDIEKKVLHVTKSLDRQKGQDIINLPKTDSSIRDIPLPEFVLNEMETYMGMLYGRTKHDRLFVVTKSHLEKEIKRGASLAGLTTIRVHDLRHSHASLLISNGVDIATISKRLGHEKIKTTLDTYTHMFEKSARGVADTLDKLKCKGEEE